MRNPRFAMLAAALGVFSAFPSVEFLAKQTDAYLASLERIQLERGEDTRLVREERDRRSNVALEMRRQRLSA